MNLSNMINNTRNVFLKANYQPNEMSNDDIKTMVNFFIEITMNEQRINNNEILLNQYRIDNKKQIEKTEQSMKNLNSLLQQKTKTIKDLTEQRTKIVDHLTIEQRTILISKGIL
jgi:hypothetical protein